MYNNVGGKIKTLAAIGGWLALIAGVVLALIFWSVYELWVGMIPLLAGIVLYISTWTMYGFGQLVEDVSMLRTFAEKEAENKLWR